MGGSTYATGAMPPPGAEWQIGKTVEEIEAINKEAEATGKTAAEVAASKAVPTAEPKAE